MRAHLSWLVAGVLVAACGPSGRTVAGPRFAAGTTVRIHDAGQIFDALNTTDCVKWPSAAVKKKAGRDAWKRFEPGAGLEGKVVAELAHCDGKTRVVLVEIGDHVVPVTSKGVEDAAKGRDAGGASPGGAIAGGGQPVPVGQFARIVDRALVEATLAGRDCVEFPTPEARVRGASSYWDGWEPSNGDEGLVIGYGTHCTSKATIAFVEIFGYVVPIGSAGIVPADPAGVGGDGYGYGGLVGDEAADWGVMVDVGELGGTVTAGGILASMMFTPGDVVEIANAGEIYSTINTTDCLTWPTAELKARGGMDAWGNYYPSQGDLGVVLGSSSHCDSAVEVLIIDVGGMIVPIKATAVALATTPLLP